MSDAQTKAVEIIAGAVGDLVDGLIADEIVVSMALCLALARRIAAQARDHEGCRQGAVMVSTLIGEAAARLMNVKIDDATAGRAGK